MGRGKKKLIAHSCKLIAERRKRKKVKGRKVGGN